MAPFFRTFDYMKKFTCIGPDCEDTCCSGWKVHLYRKDYTKIKKLLDQDQALARYRPCLKANPKGERFEESYGALDFGTQGQCGMMVDGWCLLHRDHGEKMLPTVCATFPRLIYEMRDGWEVHGRLSCPEAARLCLLSPTPPVLEDDDKGTLPEIYETNPWIREPGGYFKKHLERVNSTIRFLLALPDFTVAEKSYFVLYMAGKLAPFYYKDVDKDPGSRLERTLARMEDVGFLAKIRSNVENAALTDQVRNLTLALVNARLKGDQFKRYNELCLRLLKTYGLEGSNLSETGMMADSSVMQIVWQRFQQHRNIVIQHYEDRVQRYYTNYMVNYWSQALCVGNGELDTPTRKWLLYFSFTRFLFFSHPEVVEAAKKGLSDEEAGPILDRAIVEVIQIFMKTIDANLEMLKSFLAPMEALGFTNLTQLTSLLRV